MEKLIGMLVLLLVVGCEGAEPPLEDTPGATSAEAAGSGSCACEAGPQGEPGVPGRDGADGADGRDGQDGAPGAAGADGLDGQDGAPGPQGPQGPTSVVPGPQGPQGATGPASTVPGPQGPAGPAGPRGEAGEDGADGADGAPFRREDIYPVEREVDLAPQGMGTADAFCDAGDTFVSGSCDQGDIPMAGPGIVVHRQRPVLGGSHGFTCTAWNPNGGQRKLHVTVVCHAAP